MKIQKRTDHTLMYFAGSSFTGEDYIRKHQDRLDHCGILLSFFDLAMKGVTFSRLEKLTIKPLKMKKRERKERKKPGAKMDGEAATVWFLRFWAGRLACSKKHYMEAYRREFGDSVSSWAANNRIDLAKRGALGPTLVQKRNKHGVETYYVKPKTRPSFMKERD